MFDALAADGDEYLTFCGVLGLGQLLAGSPDDGLAERLRAHAADGRWRISEAVAMALQRVGEVDLPRLFALAADWAGDPHALVRRAAVAAVCEPALLRTPAAAAAAVDLCARVTRTLAELPPARRREPEVRALRKALGYCWSVAVAADPAPGLPRLRELVGSADRDLAWIARENLRKRRLAAYA
jgi:hypothetical protein